MEMCKLVHNDYDRIVDKVMWLGAGATLNFNIDLYYTRKTISGQRNKENFHREVIYKVDNQYKVKILRDFTYYFTIELNNKNIKDKAIIGVNNIYFIIFNLKNIIKWFIGENGINNTFAKRSDGTLFVCSKIDPIRINLAFDSYIEFKPAVDFINGYESIGAQVFLNNNNSNFFMSSDTIFSLYHMLSTSNMYMMAQNMLNYIGRPEYGTNSYNIPSAMNYENNISFFDKIGAKNESI